MKVEKSLQSFLQHWGNRIGLRLLGLVFMITCVGLIRRYVFDENFDIIASLNHTIPLCLVSYLFGIRHGRRGDYQEKFRKD